jgi:hypothetical protein
MEPPRRFVGLCEGSPALSKVAVVWAGVMSGVSAGFPAKMTTVELTKQSTKNEANREVRNMGFDEDLSQDGSEMSRKTNPTSRERGVIGSGCEASRSLSEDRVRRDRLMGSVLPVVGCPAAGRAVRPGAPPCERNAECQSCSPLFLSQPSAGPGILLRRRGRCGSSCTILEM